MAIEFTDLKLSYVPISEGRRLTGLRIVLGVGNEADAGESIRRQHFSSSERKFASKESSVVTENDHRLAPGDG